MYLSGYQNLKLVANLYKGITKERIDEVVKLVKLENRIHDKVSREKNNFLVFGTDGFIHKGIDLLIDIFERYQYIL